MEQEVSRDVSTGKTLVDKEGIYLIVPYGPEKQLLDGIREVSDDGRKVRGWRLIRDEDCRGHFNPKMGLPQIFPSIFVLEMFGQLANYLLITLFPGCVGLFNREISSDDGFDFPVLPGDLLELEVKIVSLRKKEAQIYGMAFVRGKEVYHKVAGASFGMSVVTQRSLNYLVAS